MRDILYIIYWICLFGSTLNLVDAIQGDQEQIITILNNVLICVVWGYFISKEANNE